MNLRWRSFLVRRLLARFHIGEDILRHLSTFQRLGERLEATPPGEMAPVGVRTLLRAVRTRGAAQIRPGWVWPFWLELQIDPGEESFIPRGHLPFLTNVTQRNWTMVGPLESQWEAIVDPRGLVTPWYDGWSLDWWVKTTDGWRFPSRSPEVRQRLMDSVPVVVTTLPVAGGEVVSQTFCRLDEETVVSEVQNRTPASLDIAFALRPYNPEGLAVVEKMEVDGSTVILDGRPSIQLPAAPDRCCWSSFEGGDSAEKLIQGQTGPPPRGAVKDHVGLLQSCFVYTVPPGQSVKAVMPLPHEHRRTIRRAPADKLPAPGKLPSGHEVAEGWRRALQKGMQVRVPDERLQRAIDANRAYMLLFLDRDEITPGPYTYHRFWFRDAAYQLVALDRWGFHDEAEEVLRSFKDRQKADGFFYSQWREWDSNGAALWALAEHHRLTGRDPAGYASVKEVSSAAGWIADKTAGRRRGGEEVAGLFPAGVSAEHLGPYDVYYWDDLWGWRGLLDAEYLLKLAGLTDEAERAGRAAERLRTAIFRSLDSVRVKIGRRAIPAGPRRGIDPGMIGSLAACYPLGLLAADDPWTVGTAELIRERFCIGDAFFQGISHTGLGTYLTLQLAFVELEAGDDRCLRRLRWMLDAATETFTWPEAIHPRLGGGCMGDGHHGWAAADFLSFVRNLLVRETAGGLALLTCLPEEWKGKPVEVTDAPSRHGLISYRVDWEGDDASLAWRTEREGVEIRCPGLDAAWSTVEREGRALFRGRRESKPAFAGR